MLAGSVLADVRLGDAYFMAIGPAVVFVALIAWIAVVLTTSRERRHYRGGDDGMSHRGPVMGGVIQGSPSQRTRRDPAPSVTHREVMAHIEAAREAEAPAGEAPAGGAETAVPAPERKKRGRRRLLRRSR
jgi:hypothetical protein